jgi:hypothetical protein
MPLPPSIEALTNTLLSLPGVERVEADHTPLEELNVEDLGLVPYGDLPHAALLRTKGGMPGEALGQFFIELRPELPSWHTLEFLSWQVRDCSRAGNRIQIRSRGLPPVIDGRIQLGTSLAFILEFFVDGLDEDPERLLNAIADFASGLQSSLRLYDLSWTDGTVRKGSGA